MALFFQRYQWFDEGGLHKSMVSVFFPYIFLYFVQRVLHYDTCFLCFADYFVVYLQKYCKKVIKDYGCSSKML